MKILTWNMGYPFHRSKHKEAWDYLINDLDPDIALLQEVVPSDELEESGRVLWKVEKGNSFGSAIYLKSGVLKSVEFGSYPGRVIAAEVTHLDLLLISIHAPIDQYGYIMPNLQPIFAAVKDLSMDRKFVVGGDMNTARLWDEVGGTTRHTGFFKDLEDSGFYDCAWNIHGREVQTFYGKKTNHPFQLDHLFIDNASKNRLKSCEIVEFKEPLSSFSDHVPVVMELDV